MAPMWNPSEGGWVLILRILETLFLYAFTLGTLIAVAKLLVSVPRRYLGLTNEVAFKVWVLMSVWLGTGHMFAIYAFYDSSASLVSTLSWALVAIFGFSIGLVAVAGVISGVVMACQKYL